MNFSPNKTPIECNPIEIIKWVLLVVLILETFILILIKNGIKIHLKNIDPKFYASDYYDINVNKYGVKCGTSLRF